MKTTTTMTELENANYKIKTLEEKNAMYHELFVKMRDRIDHMKEVNKEQNLSLEMKAIEVEILRNMLGLSDENTEESKHDVIFNFLKSRCEYSDKFFDGRILAKDIYMEFISSGNTAAIEFEDFCRIAVEEFAKIFEDKLHKPRLLARLGEVYFDHIERKEA